MRKIILSILLTGILQSSFAQFNGILNYENDYGNAGFNGRVLTTIYESGSKGRIESKNIPVKSGTADNAAAKDQDALLFDFDKQKQMTLHAKMNVAIVTSFDAIMSEQMMQSMGSTASVQNLGSEKVGEYNCTHFEMIIANPKIKSSNAGKKELWITKDLGSCNIFYAGPYLYYPSGSFLAKKLVAAGADGVVVKWQSGSSTGMLTGYQKKNLPSSTFTPPLNYSVNEPVMPTSSTKNK